MLGIYRKSRSSGRDERHVPRLVWRRHGRGSRHGRRQRRMSPGNTMPRDPDSWSRVSAWIKRATSRSDDGASSYVASCRMFRGQGNCSNPDTLRPPFTFIFCTSFIKLLPPCLCHIVDTYSPRRATVIKCWFTHRDGRYFKYNYLK